MCVSYGIDSGFADLEHTARQRDPDPTSGDHIHGHLLPLRWP